MKFSLFFVSTPNTHDHPPYFVPNAWIKISLIKSKTISIYSLQAVPRFMGKVRGDRVSFDPNRIVMAGGATGASELIMFCLADPGEAFLVPTPYYPA